MTEESATVALLKGKTKGKAKAKKANTEGLDAIQTTVAIIENLTGETAADVAKTLLNTADESLFTLGGVLDAIYTNAWHDGYESFKDFVEDQFGMKIRKAMYLMKIYNDLVESEVPWSKVAKLGWTKLRVISSELTKDNVGEWVKRAEEMTTLQLQEYVKGLHTGVEEGNTTTSEQEASTVTTFQVKLHEDQKDTILDAIGSAKDTAETEFDAVALEYICLEYLGGGGGAKKVGLVQLMQNHSAEKVLEAFEKVFPEVEITASM